MPSTSKLVLPAGGVDGLVADLQQPVTVLLQAYDKFGNACRTGGLRVAGRLVLVKQHDTVPNQSANIILMPNNHSVTVEDQDDGTYHVHVATVLAATVKLFVNMDKDLPANSGELAPVSLTFVKT